MKIKPLGDRVLLQVADGEEQQIKGGIVIPDSAKEKPQEAKVVALGTGGTDVIVDDEEYKILKSEDILAIVG